MRSSKTTGDLSAALAIAQLEFPAITRDQEATFYDGTERGRPYRYTSLGELLSKVRPVIAAHGMSLTQYMEPCKEGGREVVTRLQLGEQFIEHPVPVIPDDNTAQSFGAALTYAKRYGIATLLGIASEDDPDAAPGHRPTDPSGTSGRPPAQRPAQQPVQERSRPAAPASTPLSDAEKAASASAENAYRALKQFHAGIASIAWRASAPTFAAKLQNIVAADEMARRVVGVMGDRGYESLDRTAEAAGYVRTANRPAASVTTETATEALKQFLLPFDEAHARAAVAGDEGADPTERAPAMSAAGDDQPPY